MATIKGGDKLEAALSRIAAKLEHGGTLEVGFMERSTYPDGTPVAAVALWQDFGTSTIPSRPFFRNMVATKSVGWPRAVALNLKATDYDITVTLGRMGLGIRDQLQESIRQTNSPPLAKSTIRRKGFAKPLIDTSHMINSADFNVKTT